MENRIDLNTALLNLTLSNESTTSYENSLLELMEQIQTNNAWIKDNPENAKKYFEFFAKKEFSIDNTLRAKAIQTRLVSLYPALYPIKLQLGQACIYVPKQRLVEASPKFKTEFASEMMEKTTTELNIGDEDEGDEAVCQEFLDYLATGQLEITGDNVQQLIVLADKHDIPSLYKNCTNFIVNAIDNIKDFKENFDFSTNFNLTKLRDELIHQESLNLDITEDNVFELTDFAVKYGMTGLYHKCQAFILQSLKDKQELDLSNLKLSPALLSIYKKSPRIRTAVEALLRGKQLSKDNARICLEVCKDWSSPNEFYFDLCQNLIIKYFAENKDSIIDLINNNPLNSANCREIVELIKSLTFSSGAITEVIKTIADKEEAENIAPEWERSILSKIDEFKKELISQIFESQAEAASPIFMHHIINYAFNQWEGKPLVDIDLDEALASSYVTPERAVAYTQKYLQSIDNLVEWIHHRLNQDTDKYGSILYAGDYKDRLTQILKSKGVPPQDIDDEIEELLPEGENFCISISKDAVQEILRDMKLLPQSDT